MVRLLIQGSRMIVVLLLIIAVSSARHPVMDDAVAFANLKLDGSIEIMRKMYKREWPSLDEMIEMCAAELDAKTNDADVPVRKACRAKQAEYADLVTRTLVNEREFIENHLHYKSMSILDSGTRYFHQLNGGSIANFALVLLKGPLNESRNEHIKIEQYLDQYSLWARQQRNWCDRFFIWLDPTAGLAPLFCGFKNTVVDARWHWQWTIALYNWLGLND
jgi:hypothetical protein